MKISTAVTAAALFAAACLTSAHADTNLVFTNASAADQGAANISGGNAAGDFASITNQGGTTAVIISNSAPLAFTNADNSYTGDTAIEQGTLVAAVNAPNAANGAFGNSASVIQVGSTNGANANAATLLIGAAGIEVGRAITINAGGMGTRMVGATNATGTATYSGDFVMNTNVTLSASNAGGTTLFSGTLSGAGAVAKTGAGTVTLSGANTYTGTTIISAGTLQIGDGGAGGTLGAGNVNNNATLTINRNDAITISNQISGTGQLIQLGTGTTTLAGSNSYTGGTTVQGGTLAIAGPGGAVSATAALYVDNASTFVITNGGRLAATYGSVLGSTFNSSNNTVLVTGPGSVWTSSRDVSIGYYGDRNTLTISNGGVLADDWGIIGNGIDSYGNTALVTGAGSLWTNSTNFFVGANGSGNTLTISDGGRVASTTGYVGYGGIVNLFSSASNTVLVTGAGSLWTNSGTLYVGERGSGNSMTITNGGEVSVGGDLTISDFAGASNNVLNVGGGQLAVTNGTLLVDKAGAGGSGALNVSGGTVLVKQLTTTHSNGVIIFNGGTINSQGTTISNGASFIIGDTGSGAAFIANGGAHNFQNDLIVGNAGGSNSLVLSNGGQLVATYGCSLGSNFDSSNNTVLVTGPGSVFTSSRGVRIGFYGVGNTLTISNGGMLADDWGVIGDGADSSGNTALVTGAGSLWTNADYLYVGGNGSSNTLTISDGGRVASTTGHVGYGRFEGLFSSTSNTVLVTGAGSLWTNSETLYVGEGGSGNSLTITNGGHVASTTGCIGYASNSSNNTVLVTGAGSLWTNSGQLYVGVLGAGNSLVVSNGAKVSADASFIGDFNSSNNAVLLTGGGSLLTIQRFVAVGFLGSSGNSLVISNGAIATADEGIIGHETNSSNNTALVAGAGSMWTNGNLYVGSYGSGNSLTISNGGIAASVLGIIGFQTTALNNTVLVTGAGSLWTNSDKLYLGGNGAGNTLTISDGGRMASTTGCIGYTSNSSNNTVLVTGAGSLWTNSGTLYVGEGGSGNSMTITNGGAVNVGADLKISDVAGASNNVLNVAGGELAVTNGTLLVDKAGGGGSGALNISGGTVLVKQLTTTHSNGVITFNGGTINSQGTTISNGASFIIGDTGSGAAFIANGGAHNFQNELFVGNAGGSNSLTVSGGAHVAVASNSYIGYATNSSNNTALVIGAGSLWTNSDKLYVGARGAGNSLTISNGGIAASVWGIVGNAIGSTNNTVLVTGVGSLWTNSYKLIVGAYGGGSSLTISAGGRVVAQANGYIGYTSNSSNNTVLVTGAGSIWTNGSALTVGAGGGGELTVAAGGSVGAPTINLAEALGSSGTLNIGRFGTNDSGGTITAQTIGFGSGAGTINFNQVDATTMTSSIIGNGTVKQVGAGTTTLSGTNTYTGVTTISNGTLRTMTTSALGASTVQLDTGSLVPVGTLNIQSLAWNGGSIASMLGTNTSFIGISTNFTLGTNGGTFAFSDDGGFMANTAYSILGWTNWGSITASNFSGNTLFGLSPTFTINGTNLLVAFKGSSGGPTIQNGGPTYTPTNADFMVSNSVTTWSPAQNNTVNSLTFAPGSGLQVYNRLQVTSGNFTVGSGSATVQGGQLFVPGDFTKLGNGLLNLLGQVLVNGQATVSAGGLLINGEFTANSLTVLRNALLGGMGTIYGNVFNYGTVSPGNSPGTLTIVGNYTQGSTGNLDMQIANSNNFDRLVVSGAVSLAGTLSVTTVDGGTLSFGDKYQFIAAQGDINGEFDAITMPAGFRGRFLTSDNNTAGTLLVAPQSYMQMASTPNQQRVAAALDTFIQATIGDRETVSIALDELRASEYPAAFEQIMPSVYASLPTLAFNQANALNTSMFQRMWMQRVNGTGFSSQGMALEPMQAEMGGVDDFQSLAISSGRDRRWSAFADGNGIFATANSAGVLQNYRSQGGGVSAGASYNWNKNLVTGVYAGYQGLQAKYNGGTRLIDNAVRFGGFGSLGFDGWYLSSLVGGAYHCYDVDRSIQFGTIDRTANSGPSAGEFDLAVATGYDVKAGHFTFGPVTSMQYTYIGVQGFKETGANSLDLDVNPYNASSLLYSLGGQVAYRWEISKNLAVTPMLGASWQHEFMQDAYPISAAFNTGGPSSPFMFQTAQPQQDYFLGGAGVGFEIKKNWNISLFWNAVAGNSDLTSQNFYLSLGVKF